MRVFSLLFLLFSMGCAPVPEDPACNSAQFYELLAKDFEEVADLKRLCSHLVGSWEFPACQSFPSTTTNRSTCSGVRTQHQQMEVYLEQLGKPLRNACAQDEDCQSWAREANGYDGQPILPSIPPLAIPSEPAPAVEEPTPAS